MDRRETGKPRVGAGADPVFRVVEAVVVELRCNAFGGGPVRAVQDEQRVLCDVPRFGGCLLELRLAE